MNDERTSSRALDLRKTRSRIDYTAIPLACPSWSSSLTMPETGSTQGTWLWTALTPAMFLAATIPALRGCAARIPQVHDTLPHSGSELRRPRLLRPSWKSIMWNILQKMDAIPEIRRLQPRAEDQIIFCDAEGLADAADDRARRARTRCASPHPPHPNSVGSKRNSKIPLADRVGERLSPQGPLDMGRTCLRMSVEFIGLMLVSVAALPLLPPIPQDRSYHRSAVVRAYPFSPRLPHTDCSC
jgi:hypothetical protein